MPHFTPGDNLAALHERRDYGRGRRDWRTLKLEDGRTVIHPAPRLLAETFALPLLSASRELYLGGSYLVSRPPGATEDPTDYLLVEAIAEIRDALTALPERPDAGIPYDGTRAFVTGATAGAVDALLAETARSVRSLVREQARRWREPRAPKPAAERDPRTPAQRERDRRRDARAEVLADTERLLRRWLPTLPHGRHDFAAVWATWLDALERSTTAEERYPGAILCGRTAFYALLETVAADLGHAVTTHARSRHLIHAEPREQPMTESDLFADAVLERVAEKLADESRATLAQRLLAQRTRLAATGTTEARVTDLASRRAAR